MRHTVRWHLVHFVHNCVAHPLLPLAEALEELGLARVSDAFYRFHDATIPPGDPYNKQRYF